MLGRPERLVTKAPAWLGRKEKLVVLTSRIRALVLGMLAVLLAGSVMAATASAAAGPFWHHRVSTGEGEKIEPKAPENFKGTGGVQILKGKIGSEPIEITSTGLQVKGAIFNGPDRGQLKLELVYNQPKLVKPNKPNCVVTVGEKNIVSVKGHLMWKWDGTKTQLEKVAQQTEQTPDLVFSAVEPTQQKPFVEKVNMTNNGTFTTISLKGTECGVLAGMFNVSGSEVGIPNPAHTEEWSKKLAVRTVEGQPEIGTFLQHYWDQEAFQGALVGLTFAGNSASLIGQTEVEAAQQEVAVFEK